MLMPACRVYTVVSAAAICGNPAFVGRVFNKNMWNQTATIFQKAETAKIRWIEIKELSCVATVCCYTIITMHNAFVVARISGKKW